MFQTYRANLSSATTSQWVNGSSENDNRDNRYTSSDSGIGNNLVANSAENNGRQPQHRVFNKNNNSNNCYNNKGLVSRFTCRPADRCQTSETGTRMASFTLWWAFVISVLLVTPCSAAKGKLQDLRMYNIN